jgi:hypothetical protein
MIKNNGNKMLDKETMEQRAKEFLYSLVTFAQTLHPKLTGFKCNMKLDWGTTRTRSRGGVYNDGPGINLAMHSTMRRCEIGVYNEYSSFEMDPIIGSIISVEKLIILDCVIAHEVAHAVVHFLDMDDVHGPNWKHWYRIFREKFINENIVKNVHKDDISTDKRKFIVEGITHGLTEKHFGKEFVSGKNKFRVVGWRPRARKYYVDLINLETGRHHGGTPELVKKSLGI